MKFDRELLKGHLKILILAALSQRSCHAYSLIRRIQETSLGVFEVPEGTIYPTLHKLEQEGLVSSEWVEREKGPPIRLYSLTHKGMQKLHQGKREWSFFYRAMNMMLEKIADP